MIITKSEPFTKEEIEKLNEVYKTYIKTIIDIEQKICSAGMEWHYEGEQLLLQQGSAQSDIWGGGVDLKERIVTYDSLINARSRDGNASNELLDNSLRNRYKELTLYFLKELFL